MASLADLKQRLEHLIEAIGEHDEDVRAEAATWWGVGQWPTGAWVIFTERTEPTTIVLTLGTTKGEAWNTLYSLEQWQYTLARRRAEYTMGEREKEQA